MGGYLVARFAYMRYNYCMANPKKPRTPCPNCGGTERTHFIAVYCNNKCYLEYKKKEKVRKWLAGEIEGGSKAGLAFWAKRYLIETRGEKCEECGWCKKHPDTGRVPLDAHHMNGHDDHRPESIKLLCPNHHALTETYRALNTGKGRTYRRGADSQ